MLSEQMDFRLYDYPQDAPLPTADIRASGSAFTPRVVSLMERADREGLSIRECGTLVAASRSHGSFVGTPEQLADYMQLWLDEGACDGFNIMPAYFQDELELFVDEVVPLLQRRGLFRTEYAGPRCAITSGCRGRDGPAPEPLMRRNYGTRPDR